MANKFVKKEWVDRQSQYPTRRRLTSTSIENVYDVERAEGDVPEPGDAFDAANMNDIEDRVYNAFGLLDGTDISILDTANHFTSNNVEGALSELFMYASDGKKKIANAIGGSPSDTFSQLAALAGEIKIDRDTGKKVIAESVGGLPSMSFDELARLASNENIKKTIAEAIGVTKSGTPTGNESIEELAGYIENDKKSFYYFSHQGNQLNTTIYPNGEAKSIHIPCALPFIPSFLIIEEIELQAYGDNFGDYYHIAVTNKMEDSLQLCNFFDVKIKSISQSEIQVTFSPKSKMSERYNRANIIVGASTKIYTFI